VCQELGLEMDENIFPQIAFGFAGGIGNTGEACGAVVGGVMALGLVLGRGGSMEEMMANLDIAQDFARRFRERMGHVTCRDLTGCDISTPEARMQYMDSKVPEEVCFPAVGTAYEIVMEVLKEQE